MTELQLYKFIKSNGIEIHNNDGEVYCFIPYELMPLFVKMLSPCDFDDGGIKATLKRDDVYIELNDICDAHGIDATQLIEED